MTRPLLLLVDDAPEMGLIVRSLARRAGWDVTVRIDAEAAWHSLDERRPDLILLDVNLPGASGLDWLRRVRGTPELAGLTVALYTHWGLPADVAAGLDAGVDFVFDKDLATRPADWQQRLAEIGEAGRGGEVRCMAESRFSTYDGRGSAANPADAGVGGRLQPGPSSSRASPPDAGSVAGRDAPGLDIGLWTADTPPDPGRLDRPRRAGPGASPAQLGPGVARGSGGVSCGSDRSVARGGSRRRVSRRAGGRPRRGRIPVAAMKASHSILLVEDNPADVKITQRALREGGLPVDLLVVRDGQEAVEYLMRQGTYEAQSDWRVPDLILLDINLPRLNGLQVLERIRSTPALRTTPVVVLTTSRRQEDVQQMYAAGANTYIEKPQDFNRFVQVLQTIQRYWLETALLPPSP